MKILILKFIKEIKSNGFIFAFQQCYGWFHKKIFGIGEIASRRIFLSNKLNKEFNGIIRYGPFKDFRFVDKSWWGTTDRGSMLLGLYEQEVLKSLQNIPEKYEIFIDLGAADGYYGIGVLINGLFKKSYCYEMSSEGQKTIEKNAKLNNCLDKIEIRGFADKDFYHQLSPYEIDTSVLFVDIEGGEFDLLDKNLLKNFSKSIIFIEIHDWVLKERNRSLDEFENLIKEFFSIKKLTTSARDLSSFNELKDMCDTDRWLICSEGRGKLMSWWRLDPL